MKRLAIYMLLASLVLALLSSCTKQTLVPPVQKKDKPAKVFFRVQTIDLDGTITNSKIIAL